ncbi:hypothetical protein FACS1894140_0160 [Spirochaetia bacterium]|nr:hypothetical protein FACS1894140_0160 [Spirochaetia bacterium]
MKKNILWMLTGLALVLALGGCSKSTTPSPAPAQVPASESPALTQEQIAAEAARQAAEQTVEKPAAQQPVPAPTPAAAETPAPALAASPASTAVSPAATPGAAKKYVEGSGVKPAIGDIGPGGGTIFAVDGFSYKEVTGPLGKVNVMSHENKETSYRGNGLAGWYTPSWEELEQVYQTLGKTKKAAFGTDYFCFREYYFDLTKAGRPSGLQEIPGFPGAYIQLAGGGGGNDLMRLSDGAESKVRGNGSYNLVLVRSVREPAVKVYAKGDTGPGGGIILKPGKNGGDSSYIEARIIGEAASFAEAQALARNYRGNGLGGWTVDGMYNEYLLNMLMKSGEIVSPLLNNPIWMGDAQDNYACKYSYVNGRIEGGRVPQEEGKGYDVLALRTVYGFGASAGLESRQVEPVRLK